MKTKAFTPMGSLHPILFFVVVYVVALFFSIFICSSLFYSCNSSPASIGSKPVKQETGPSAPGTVAASIAMQ